MSIMDFRYLFKTIKNIIVNTEPEWDVDPATNHETYKAYLKNRVRSWINTINKTTAFND